MVKSQTSKMAFPVLAGFLASLCFVALVTLCACGSSNNGDSAFEKAGMKATMEVGKSYDINLTCLTDTSKTTDATVEIIKRKTFASDDTHKAKDGYEYQQQSLRITLSDDAAWNYGFTYGWVKTDYYKTDLFSSENATEYVDAEQAAKEKNQSSVVNKSSGTASESQNKESTLEFSLTYKGETYDCFLTEQTSEEGWTTDEKGNHKRTVEIAYEAKVPKGYDGLVFGVMDGSLLKSTAYTEGKDISTYYNESKFLLYRFQ